MSESREPPFTTPAGAAAYLDAEGFPDAARLYESCFLGPIYLAEGVGEVDVASLTPGVLTRAPDPINFTDLRARLAASEAACAELRAALDASGAICAEMRAALQMWLAEVESVDQGPRSENSDKWRILWTKSTVDAASATASALSSSAGASLLAWARWAVDVIKGVESGAYGPGATKACPGCGGVVDHAEACWPGRALKERPL